MRRGKPYMQAQHIASKLSFQPDMQLLCIGDILVYFKVT